jgi:glutamate--cysteine ligase
MINAQERKDIDYNELATAHRGRDPKLMLHRQGKKIHLKEWAGEIVDAMAGVCDLLDAGDEQKLYAESLAAQAEKIQDPDRTPSARMLSEMRAEGEGFFHFALRMSQQHQQYFQKLEQDTQLQAKFSGMAEQSWMRQRELEAENGESFAAYLQRYFAQTG